MVVLASYSIFLISLSSPRSRGTNKLTNSRRPRDKRHHIFINVRIPSGAIDPRHLRGQVAGAN